MGHISGGNRTSLLFPSAVLCINYETQNIRSRLHRLTNSFTVLLIWIVPECKSYFATFSTFEQFDQYSKPRSCKNCLTALHT